MDFNDPNEAATCKNVMTCRVFKCVVFACFFLKDRAKLVYLYVQPG